MSNWKSRKFWLAVGSVLLFSVLLWTGKIDQSVYEHTMWLVLGGYFVSNQSQKYIDKTGEKR